MDNLEQQQQVSYSEDATTNKTIADVGERRYTGVGTLIITSVNGQPYLVLGREAFKSIKHRGAYMVSIFEEFGGGIQRRRATLADNACFELREETSNLIDLTDCSYLLENQAQHFDLPFRDDRIYRLYVINIPDAHTIIPYLQVNRQIITRALNQPEKGTKSKIKTFLEMDTILWGRNIHLRLYLSPIFEEMSSDRMQT